MACAKGEVESISAKGGKKNMNQETREGQGQDESKSRLERHKLAFGSSILVGGFIGSVLIAYFTHPPLGIGIMGIGILLTVLIGGNVLSKTHDLTTAEVRRAIAISFVSVFFGLLAFGDAIEIDNNFLKAILENFWWIIITVIGFYFGGRSAEKVVEEWAKKAKNKNQSGE